MTKSGRVFCVGETVLDIIFQGDLPVAAKPGGSMLNSAVSLGRAGIPVHLISDYGSDHAGDLIHKFLMQNAVSTAYISRYTQGQTALALAFLDDQQNADYSFYKIFPEERLTISLPSAQAGDIVLFGSFYALTRSVRPKIMAFIQNAKSNGAFIIYDPNFRRAHLSELEIHRPWIIENIGLSNLVRGSDEDFLNIFDASDARQAYQYVSGAGCSMLVYTRSSKTCEVVTNKFSKSYIVPKIQVVSTIGAGDTFNAGMIYAMMKDKIAVGEFQTSDWDNLIDQAIRFSAEVCQSLDNYISVEFGVKSSIFS
jgi:fructokinase